MSAPGEETPPPSEEEMRAAYEAELSRISAADLIVQAAVSLLNVGAYRMGPPPGTEEEGAPTRDLEQVRDSVDAVSALLKVLERRMEARELAPLRDALSRLQMAYAREAPPAGARTAAERPASAEQSNPNPDQPGPAEASGRLWVPGR